MISPASPLRPLALPALGRRRGFTLVELMAVVSMVGILSAIAMVGYRKYVYSARVSDAKAVMSGVRIAQENIKAETLSYLNCSLNGYYPAAPDGNKRNFYTTAHSDDGCWRTLNVVTDTPTYFGFQVVAGLPGSNPAMPPSAPAAVNTPPWPTPSDVPWYSVSAAGDNDKDGDQVFLLSSSFNGEIFVHNEGE